MSKRIEIVDIQHGDRLFEEMLVLVVCGFAVVVFEQVLHVLVDAADDLDIVRHRHRIVLLTVKHTTLAEGAYHALAQDMPVIDIARHQVVHRVAGEPVDGVRLMQAPVQRTVLVVDTQHPLDIELELLLDAPALVEMKNLERRCLHIGSVRTDIERTVDW